MSTAMTWLAVAAAGGLGAVARHLVDLGVSRRSASRSPVGTIVVNVTGSLLAGMVAGLAVAGRLGVEVEFVVAGGFLGAYTTFSTAMFQAVVEFEQRRPLVATTHLIATLALAVGAAWLGVTITT